MRVLVGVDGEGSFWQVVEYVKRLAFDQVEIDLVRVVESILPDKSTPELPADHPLASYYRMQAKSAQEMLDAAQAALAKDGIPARTFLYYGDAAREIVSHADRESCDLITVRSSSKGKWGSLFFGSVSKGVLIGSNKSTLIVKAPPPPTDKLTAVLATDHSPYFNRCLEILVAIAPKGIGRMIAMTSTAPAKLVHALLGKTSGLGDLTAATMDEEAANNALCEKLREKFPNCYSVIKENDPAEAIAETMKEASADLLIMGAQGHGYFERLRLGSQSFHQVVNTPHNVLILRLPSEKGS